MKILIFNWRDIKNPAGGGAEVLTHEMAKRWVKWRHEVTQFSELFDGAKKEETIGGVRIVRGGTARIMSCHMPVHLAAYFWYKNSNREKFDVVVDEIHGIPFFTPFYVREKKVALICEVANEIWDTNFKFPFNKIGRFIEKNYFRFYKKTPFVTISRSTEKDLIEMGIKREQIVIVPMGISVPKAFKEFSKEKAPTLIFVGRLTKSKGIEDAILVVSFLRNKIPNIKLWVVGRGEEKYVNYLKNLSSEYSVEDNVTFLGFVSQYKKFELMSRAHLLIAPSIKEGWGLIVQEAGLCNTPSVGYDVGGLRDIIKNNKTGLLVRKDVSEMTKGIEELLANTDSYEKLKKGAFLQAQAQNWDNTAKVALSILKN